MSLDDGMMLGVGGRAVSVELHGPVFEVAAVRAWLEARAGFADSLLVDEPDGSVRVRMTVIPPTE